MSPEKLAEPSIKTAASLALVFTILAGGVVTKDILTDTVPKRLRCTTYDADAGYREQVTVVAEDKATAQRLWQGKAEPMERSVVGRSCRELEVSTWERVVGVDETPTEQPLSCACAPLDGGCVLADGGPAPLRAHLAEGTFGAGCVPKPCMVWAGNDPLPKECWP